MVFKTQCNHFIYMYICLTTFACIYKIFVDVYINIVYVYIYIYICIYINSVGAEKDFIKIQFLYASHFNQCRSIDFCIECLSSQLCFNLN